MRSLVTLVSAFAIFLVGCSKSTGTLAAQSRNVVAVNVHGVNYTAEPFRYVIEDAKDPKNSAGGEHIGPFSGGGIVCCYMLPAQWTPGIKVKIHSTHWLSQDANGNLPEVNKEYVADVPQYPNGEVAEIWVLRTAAGGIELVVSDVQPNHPEWTGKVKGWPKPSLAYQHKRWEQNRARAASSIQNYRDLLEGLASNPGKVTQGAWEFAEIHKQEEIAPFKGPHDPEFEEYLRKKYAARSKNAESDMEQLNREKP